MIPFIWTAPESWKHHARRFYLGLKDSMRRRAFVCKTLSLHLRSRQGCLKTARKLLRRAKCTQIPSKGWYFFQYVESTYLGGISQRPLCLRLRAWCLESLVTYLSQLGTYFWKILTSWNLDQALNSHAAPQFWGHQMCGGCLSSFGVSWGQFLLLGLEHASLLSSLLEGPFVLLWIDGKLWQRGPLVLQ